MSTAYPDHPPSAIIQVPSGSGGNKHSIPCSFLGMDGKRLGVDAREAIATSTAVSVEFNDALFLGDVMSCERRNDGWHLEIKVEQILTGLESLIALRARLLGEAVPQALSLVPAGMKN